MACDHRAEGRVEPPECREPAGGPDPIVRPPDDLFAPEDGGATDTGPDAPMSAAVQDAAVHTGRS